MASSGYILKRREDVEFDELLHDIKLAAVQAGLEVRIDLNVLEDDFNGGVYTMGSIADTYEDIPGAQQWCMYIHSDGRDLHEFDHIAKNEHLIMVMMIELVSDCEQILLDFLLEYFKLNQKDYFFVEEYEFEWYYTYDDVKRIKQKAFDPYWCYKDPHVNSSNI